MTTKDKDNEQNQTDTQKPKSGCGTALIITAILLGVMVLLVILYISALAEGFANS